MNDKPLKIFVGFFVILSFLVALAALWTGLAYLTMLAWNALMPSILGLPEVGLKSVMAAMLLVSITSTLVGASYPRYKK